MRNYFFIAGLLISLISAERPAHALSCYPFQLGLAPPAQLVPKEDEVCGLRLNLLWGENKAVGGIDAGLLMNKTESFRGIELGGLANLIENTPEATAAGSWGLQVAGVANTSLKSSFIGAQAAGVVNVQENGSLTGVQAAGIMNIIGVSSINGIQVALFSNQNFESEVTGLQLAAFNQAKKMNGIQLGLANGVSAAEGAVAVIVVPIDVLIASGGGKVGVPFYVDPQAHVGAAVNGIQLGVFANITENMHGAQLSGFINSAKDMYGLQVSIFNISEKSFSGIQVGFLNFFSGSTSDVTGLQLSAFNNAKNMKGLQAGFINVCNNLNGLQIGAMNIVTSRFHAFPGSVPFAPVMNIGF